MNQPRPNRLVASLAWLLVSMLVACSLPSPTPAEGDDAEQAAWVPLLDGSSLDAWTNVKGGPAGEKWQVIDGALVLTEGGGGDILSRDTYADFELELEWNISEGGNSGVFYLVAQDGRPVWTSGLEYQVLDDESFPVLTGSSELSASLFALYSPAGAKANPAGSYNTARIRVRKGRVEHWLNGIKVVEFSLWSDDFTTRVANSKFAAYSGFARAERGHIALQDHGGKVSYRNIRIRPL